MDRKTDSLLFFATFFVPFSPIFLYLFSQNESKNSKTHVVNRFRDNGTSRNNYGLRPVWFRHRVRYHRKPSLTIPISGIPPFHPPRADKSRAELARSLLRMLNRGGGGRLERGLRTTVGGKKASFSFL